MEVTARRNIKSGKEYDHLFPPAEGSDVLIKKGATLEDTVEFLPEVILKTLDQTKRIAPLFKSKTVKETCRKIWQWIYENIRYVKDERGKEQIKSPSRTWKDRSGDCDDFTVFISSILCNLDIVPHKLRIALYSYANGYQHIYPVAKDEKGETIIIDCVTEQFNYEVPYLKKKEKKMDLYYLNGISDQDENLNIDAEDLSRGEIGELGLKLKKLKDTKLFQGLKKGLHAINKINPATALLRAGVLASMKMNIMNVAGRIRYAYLNDAEARKRGFDMNKFVRLKSILQKLEKIFHGAGGEIKNLKEAILTGKGNSGNDVPMSGFGNIDRNTYSENTPLSIILGDRIYRSEVQNVEGLSGTLGEPATAAAVAAATSALAVIAELLKQIGNIKGNSAASTQETVLVTDNNTGVNTVVPADFNTTSSGDDVNESVVPQGSGEDQTYLRTTDTTLPATDTTTPTKTGAWQKIKDWVKKNPLAATGIGIVVVGGASYGIYRLVTPGKKAKAKSGGLSGIPGKKRRKKKSGAKSKGSGKIRFVKLK